jgi:prevent-host-death family protein
MIVVNVHEAKTHLSRLLQRVEAGERVVIARAGKPVAELVAGVRGDIIFGTAAGDIVVADDFDEPSDDVVALFEDA